MDDVVAAPLIMQTFKGSCTHLRKKFADQCFIDINLRIFSLSKRRSIFYKGTFLLLITWLTSASQRSL